MQDAGLPELAGSPRHPPAQGAGDPAAGWAGGGGGRRRQGRRQGPRRVLVPHGPQDRGQDRRLDLRIGPVPGAPHLPVRGPLGHLQVRNSLPSPPLPPDVHVHQQTPPEEHTLERDQVNVVVFKICFTLSTELCTAVLIFERAGLLKKKVVERAHFLVCTLWHPFSTKYLISEIQSPCTTLPRSTMTSVGPTSLRSISLQVVD